MNSLYGTPVTGLQGASFQLDVVANNIANLNTSGFEDVEPLVGSLPAQAEIGDPNNGIPIAATTHVGMGVQPTGTMRSQAQAAMEATGNPLDLALDGPNYFTLRQPNGTLVYAKQVSLHLQPDGQVVSAQSLALYPPVRVPKNVIHLTADASGGLIGLTASGASARVATLAVTTFAAPENLRAEGDGVYTETLGSGRPLAPARGTAQIWSGYQLKSTVDLATEMTNMIEAERVYQANTKALQTMDALVNTAVSVQPR